MASSSPDTTTRPAAGAVFLSYAREDAAAARRIADALRAFGVEVWFDQSELRGGDAWDQKIKKQIRECALFLPLVSAHTQARTEGYFRREWLLAVERTRDMAARRAFVVPVAIDEVAESAADVPEEFLRVQWMRLPRGVPSAQFVDRIQHLIGDYTGAPAGGAGVASGTNAARPPRRTTRIVMAAAALMVVAAIAWWKLAPRGSAMAVAAGQPVIVFMDSRDKPRVYDEVTQKNGGTNADDLTDLLRDLPASLVKETTSRLWHREDQIVRENPALIMIHRSCFFEATAFPDTVQEAVYPLAADKFESFVGYVGLASPRTKFFIYSRRSWANQAEAEQWKSELEHRFPALTGRMVIYPVPLDRATFRHPLTGHEVKDAVEKMLGLTLTAGK